MYGVEAMTGLGGLAAQAQPNAYGVAAMRIRAPGSAVIGSHGGTYASPTGLPYTLGGGPQVSVGGGAVEMPASQQTGSWREILDFHNSPAPWILALMLLIYGWTHVAYRRRGM